MSRRYYRQFIALKQERTGFSIPGKMAQGRAIIEASGKSGKLSIFIQDLVPKAYKLAFIANNADGNIGLHVGVITPDLRGRYEGRYEFAAESISESDIDVRQISAVCVFVEENGEITAPLVGYKSAIFSWRVGLNFFAQPEGAAFTEAQNADISNADIDEPHAPKIPPEPEENQEPEPAASEPEQQPASEPPPEPPMPQSPDYTVIEPPIAAATHEAEPFAELFARATPVSIFREHGETDDILWITTSLDQIAPVNQKAEGILASEFVKNRFERYRHILMGRIGAQGEIRHIIGVPDTFDSANATPAEIGFDTFKCCHNAQPAQGSHGYWLADL